MKGKVTKEDCILLLQAKLEEVGRLSKETDFAENEVAMIKSHLN